MTAVVAETKAEEDESIKNSKIEKIITKTIKNVPVSIALEFDFSFIKLSINIVNIEKSNIHC